MDARSVLARVSVTRSLWGWGAVVALVGGCPRSSDPVPVPASASPQTAEAPVAAMPVASPVEPEPPTEPAPKPAPKPEPAPELEFAFVGDVIFGRYRGDAFDPIPEDGFAVFEPMKAALTADVLVGNLETPVVRELPETSPIGSKYRFGAGPKLARHLVDAGFDVVSLANNHWFDMRKAGLEEGPEVLRELGVMPIGEATSPASFRVQTLEHEGWSIGFVALTTRTNAPLRAALPQTPYLATRDIEATIVPVLEAARDDHDLLVVMIHWGDEKADAPSYVQRRAARAMVDAGADLIVGHHPHVLQAVEVYKTSVIAYSLGNFLFENTSTPPRLTGVLRVNVRRDRCIDAIRFHPAYVKRHPVQHPVPATGYMRRQVAQRLREVSEPFETRWEDDGDDLIATAPCTDGA